MKIVKLAKFLAVATAFSALSTVSAETSLDSDLHGHHHRHRSSSRCGCDHNVNPNSGVLTFEFTTPANAAANDAFRVAVVGLKDEIAKFKTIIGPNKTKSISVLVHDRTDSHEDFVVLVEALSVADIGTETPTITEQFIPTTSKDYADLVEGDVDVDTWVATNQKIFPLLIKAAAIAVPLVTTFGPPILNAIGAVSGGGED